MEDMIYPYKILNIKPDEKIILQWFLGKKNGKLWTGCIWLWIGTSGGPL
jgi:hypothetical protein